MGEWGLSFPVDGFSKATMHSDIPPLLIQQAGRGPRGESGVCGQREGFQQPWAFEVPQRGWGPAGTPSLHAATLEMALWVISAPKLPETTHVSERTPSPFTDSMTCPLRDRDPSHLWPTQPTLTPPQSLGQGLCKILSHQVARWGSPSPLYSLVPWPSQ